MGSATAPGSFFSQTPDLLTGPAAPEKLALPQSGWTSNRSALAAAYNRMGGLIQTLASRMQVPVPPALAVFFVESGGKPLIPGQAVIRFEVALLWQAWGQAQQATFDAHFQFGGHNGVIGQPWEKHAFRANSGDPFAMVHTGQQATEYAAFTLATQLAGKETAVRCISLGGFQILGSAFAWLGYANAAAMFDAFQSNEKAHVLGFFDFCAHKPAPQRGQLLDYLRQGNFPSFAQYYNGKGQIDFYAGLIQKAMPDVMAVLAAGG